MARWHDEDGDREPDEDEEGQSRVIRYLYDQEDILATFTDTGREVARYAHGPGIDEPLAEVRKHRTRFYHADVLGSIIGLTEKHGHSARSYRYSAFGVPEDHRGDPQPYRFTGREWDKEVGLYYYRKRYYGPRLGRFLREDPLSSKGARTDYGYVRNSPLRYVDPSGLQEAPPAGARAVFGETSGLYPQLARPVPNPYVGVMAPANWNLESLRQLQQARADIARAFANGAQLFQAGPPSSADPLGVRQWQYCVAATGLPSDIPADVRHFFIRADTGPQSPWWAGTREPYRTYGPFINLGGGDVPRSTEVYIDFYRGVR